ncbi:MAG: DUF2330 domain-containing protein [Leptolyngbyaceae cyanobacterium bins.59]|nr:DUF2330 domain-containing protein [Leptolyngbyaceae cyanobacterium bins.59]
MKPLQTLASLVLAFWVTFSFIQPAWAFCGFYVAKADTKLYNKASQVAIARDGKRTILTMENDYQGDVKDFAIVVPVPVLLKEEQVRVGDPKIMERLDSFSAPRLVEYFDSNPCDVVMADQLLLAAPSSASTGEAMNQAAQRRDALGVTVEAKFTVGEYDILLLSAKESGGLETWLIQNGYKMPPGARQLLQPYIRQQMKFFVAKVNLTEFDKSGFQSLRPLMIAYESPKFMLPIRLGMMNAQTDQDLIVYLLSPKGQIELTNYRTVKVPSDVEIPEFVKGEFGPFYQAMFQTAYTREDRRVGFLEYAWDMAGCDPCSADPLNYEELRKAGVFWLSPNQPTNVFITRLHVRYSRDKFPEDLMFQETSNRQQFQGRYILQHPYTGEMTCSAARDYKRSVRQRVERQVQTLAKLTGWNIQEIRKKARVADSEPEPWWERAFSSTFLGRMVDWWRS